jgi:hypothetical protein
MVGGREGYHLFVRVLFFSDTEQTKMYLFLIKIFAYGFELLKTRTWVIINPAKKIMFKKNLIFKSTSLVTNPSPFLSIVLNNFSEKSIYHPATHKFLLRILMFPYDRLQKKIKNVFKGTQD